MSNNKELVEKLNLTPSEQKLKDSVKEKSETSKVDFEPSEQKLKDSVEEKSKALKTNPTPSLTKADVMWENLKDVQLDLFGIPNQKLSNYCNPVSLDPSKLFLKLKNDKKTATAVISALSNAVYPKYEVEHAGDFFVVSEV